MDNNKISVSTYNRIAAEYTRQYFNDLSDIPKIDKFLRLMPVGSKVLDIGCGPGTFTKYLLRMGYDVEGIDLSREMIKMAEKKVPKGKFKLMDMRKLKYERMTFDGLLVAYSLIHIPSKNISMTLKGFYRVLKPGGRMMIIVQKGEADRMIDEPLQKGEKMFFNFFTRKRLASFLEKAGFKVEYQKESSMQDPDQLSDKVIYSISRR